MSVKLTSRRVTKRMRNGRPVVSTSLGSTSVGGGGGGGGESLLPLDNTWTGTNTYENDTFFSAWKVSEDSNGHLLFTGGTDKDVHFSGNVHAFSDSIPPVASWWDDMPIATTTSLGGIIVGANLTIDANGVLNGQSGGTGSAAWGGISGNIADQSDLVAELATKGSLTGGNSWSGAQSFANQISVTGDGTSTQWKAGYDYSLINHLTEEVDTLASVTGRGATTSTNVSFNGDVNIQSWKLEEDANGHLILTGSVDKDMHVSGNVHAFSDTTPPASTWWDEMPIATNLILGGIKEGAGLTIAADGTANVTGGGMGATWGQITGTLANQTDLQNELDAKGNLLGGNTWDNVQVFNRNEDQSGAVVLWDATSRKEGQLYSDTQGVGIFATDVTNGIDGLYINNTLKELDLRLSNNTIFEIHESYIQSNQDIRFNDKALIASYSGSSNIDHIWHNDSSNEWNFVSDGSYKQSGNSLLVAGGFKTPSGTSSMFFKADGSIDNTAYARINGGNDFIGTNTFSTTISVTSNGNSSQWNQGYNHSTYTGNPHGTTLSDIGESKASINYWVKSGSNLTYSDGNVGINTTSMPTELNVAASGANGILLKQDLSTIENSARLFLENGYGGSSIRRSGTSMHFSAGASAGSSSGSLIMELSDDGKLHVEGADVSQETISWKNGAARKAGYLYSDTLGVAIYTESLADSGIYLNYTDKEISFYAGSSSPISNMTSKDFRIGASTHSPISATVSTVTIGGTNTSVSGGIAFQMNGVTSGYLYSQLGDMIYQAQAGDHKFNSNIESTGDIIAYA